MKTMITTLAIYLSATSAIMAAPLTVHEWGTFTSFMGSNGELIEGMHHEDEALPGFVYGLKKEENQLSLFDKGFTPQPPPPPRPHCGGMSKVGCSTLRNLTLAHSELFPESPLSSGVTQKMETPVIYFYGQAGQKVNVEINFPQGIITQYFPSASFAYPKLKDAKELKDGRFVFDVTLLNPAVKSLPATNESSIWNPARNVPAANVVSASGENEKFIFYRGIGNFPSPLKVTSNDNDILTLNNVGASSISMAIVLNSDGKVGNLKAIYNVTNKAQIIVPSLENALPFKEYIQKTKSIIISALVNKGLFHDEAVAMVNTWEKSYFHTPGTRVLYIVPDEDTESIIPLAIKPSPTQLVRALVGRVEIMTKNEETSYLQIFERNTSIDDVSALFGRFSEAKLRRLEQIAPTHLKAKILSLIK